MTIGERIAALTGRHLSLLRAKGITIPSVLRRATIYRFEHSAA